MANETMITLTGRLTADPELRYTGGSVPVASFTIACNDRQYDRNTQQWADGEPVFWRCSAWREMGERVAATLRKGHAVVAYGQVKGRKYTDQQGQERLTHDVDITAIGPDLRWMEVSGAEKAAARQGYGQPAGQGYGQPAGYGAPTAVRGAQQGYSPAGAYAQPAASDEPPY